MSNCDYCVAPRKCNCGVKCLNCFKAKHLYETSLKILHYQPNQPHNCEVGLVGSVILLLLLV